MTEFNKGITINFPPGLERTVAKILQDRIGRENSISRTRLLSLAQTVLPKTTDRQLRACINNLRKAEMMICSTGGDDGGYWLAANWDELQEYLEREVVSRLADLSDQRYALTKAAEKRWGWVANQERML